MRIISLAVFLLISACSKSGSGHSNPLLPGTSPAKEPETKSPTSKEDQAPLKELRNDTDSKLTISETNHRQVFVGPSKHDRILIRNIRAINANYGFCKQLSSFYEMNLQTEKKKESIALKKKEIEKLIENKAPEYEISSQEDQLSFLEKSYKRSVQLLGSLQETFEKEVAFVDVQWESGWEKNITILQTQNPEYTFVKGNAPSKVELTLEAQGLRFYPAEKMLINFKESYGLTDIGDGKFSQEELQDSSFEYSQYATLFSVCPLGSPASHEHMPSKNQVEIDVFYSF